MRRVSIRKPTIDLRPLVHLDLLVIVGPKKPIKPGFYLADIVVKYYS